MAEVAEAAEAVVSMSRVIVVVVVETLVQFYIRIQYIYAIWNVCHIREGFGGFRSWRV